MNELKIVTELLGLAHVGVTNYRMKGQNEIEISLETTLEAAVCPDCGELSVTMQRKDEAQSIRDLTMWNRRCTLRYTPHRFRCSRCQATFVEQVAWRSAGTSYTERYEQHLYARTCREPIAQIAQDEGVSEDTVQAIFVRWAKKQSPSVAIRA